MRIRRRILRPVKPCNTNKKHMDPFQGAQQKSWPDHTVGIYIPERLKKMIAVTEY